MKVAFVLDDSLDGNDGVQQYVVTLGKWMARQGHSVHYLVGRSNRKDVRNVHSLARVVRVPFNGNVAGTPLPVSKKRIREVLAQLAPDVIHVQLPCSPVFAGRVVAAAGERCAVIGTYHVLPSSRLSGAANIALGRSMHRVISRFDTLLAVSKPAADLAAHIYDRDTLVLPAAIDTKAWKVATRSRNPTLEIRFLGRLVPRKGALELIRAFHQAAIANAHLTIGGDGPLMRRATKLARQVPNVTIAGFIPETKKAAYLAGADMAVFPSTRGESFGIVLVEAMASGAGVVIGGDNPGYRSVLGEGPALVTPRDSHQFARQLSALAGNVTIRRKIHTKQHAMVMRYDVANVGDKLLRLYARALARRRA